MFPYTSQKKTNWIFDSGNNLLEFKKKLQKKAEYKKLIKVNENIFSEPQKP